MHLFILASISLCEDTSNSASSQLMLDREERVVVCGGQQILLT